MNTPLDELWNAIHDKGDHPEYHDAVMARHRGEWPTLWAAIDRVLYERSGCCWDCLEASRRDEPQASPPSLVGAMSDTPREQLDYQFGTINSADVADCINEVVNDPEFRSLMLSRHADGQLYIGVSGIKSSTGQPSEQSVPSD